MEEGESSSDKRTIYNEHGFMDFIFSWSIQDILDEEFFKKKIEKNGLSFQSIDHYLRSYRYLVLEETRATLCSSMELIYQAPYGRVVGLKLVQTFNKKNDIEMDKPFKNKLYNLKIDRWENRFIHREEPYKTLPGDVMVLADCKPESANDLQRFGRMWCFLSIVKPEDENDGENIDCVCFKVTASKDLDLDELRNKSLYIVFLANVGSNRKIWTGLHMTSGNSKLFKQILCTDEDEDDVCPSIQQ
ncbi:hypothetical protein TSUD_174470 [Trifolium subterraneum]|uniref:DUF6469 domain-containing protein n=1 Tax=Trifolium subterraneum TaxID=3900 RepID=A0A2Z6NQF9_TRISU|nr:hypothetical protein TSUD_174470 [Trifolium subterraneum]